MPNMKERRLSDILIPIVADLLRKDGIDYKVGDGKLITALTSNQYHKYVMQAKCMAQKGERDVEVLTCEAALQEDRPHNFELLQSDRYSFLRAVN